MRKVKAILLLTVFLGCTVGVRVITNADATAQSPSPDRASEKKTARGPAKPVTIPVGIRVRGGKPEAELQIIDLNVFEDGEPQSNLSIRSIGTNSPLTIEVLIQDDLVPSVSNEIKPIREFIRRLPKSSRVMVGYVRAGSLEVRQKFTGDLEKAANALRVPLGLASAAPFNPYVELLEGISRFDSQPSGRRAILLVSDGLDLSRGLESSSAGQSVDLQRAIKEAQRRAVAVYSFYAPSTAVGGNQTLIGNGQSSLQRLSDESGGRAFFQGTGAPVSFDPFLSQLSSSLDRQVALTYLSTHGKKGFHRLQIRTSTPGVELTYPAGYTR
jgi:VWFA-related protein